MNIEQFKIDVAEGLSKSNKTLPSKYFYNKKGDELFVQIMHLPEYYLTRSEFEIFSTKASNLIQQLTLNKETYFELIELGAGDGSKTIELLKQLKKEAYNFGYTPIDISANTLDVLERNIHAQLPNFEVKKLAGDYFKKLGLLNETKHPKVVLFLGSNIGNLTDDQSSQFLEEIAANLNPNDKLMLGVDLRKRQEIILPAYNDSKGVTKAFNLNLLQRINEKLDADFNLNHFTHTAEYKEEEGVARSYIMSKCKQTINIKALGRSFDFEENEKIHTEISRKYDDAILNEILSKTSLSIIGKETDQKAYFADYILEVQ